MSELVPAWKYCTSIFDGTHDTPSPADNGYPLITSKHMKDGCLDSSSAYLISSRDYESINKRSKVSQWDVLFSMIGTVGEVYLEKNSSINYAIKNIGVFSCRDLKKAKWLYYYFKSPIAKNHIKKYLSGAVQKFLPLGVLRDFPILLYDEISIKGIELISLIDEKIQLNNQINTQLEKIAKTLYDYWFIQFEFPDENGNPYKSSGGKMVYSDVLNKEIPEDWQVVKLKTILKTALGGTPSKNRSDFWDNATIPWLNSGEIVNFPIISSETCINQKGLNNSAAVLLPKGSVVISIVRYIRPSILAIDAATNQSVVAIYESDKLKYPFIYQYILNQVSYLMSLRTGAQQPHINKGEIDNLFMIAPKDKVLEKYYEMTIPIYTKIISNSIQTSNLVKLRDWLLPMLINGQVKVK